MKTSHYLQRTGISLLELKPHTKVHHEVIHEDITLLTEDRYLIVGAQTRYQSTPRGDP